MTGWIKLHRKLIEWEWYDDANSFRLFIHLLLTSNHSATKWHGINIPEGSQITGRKSLSKKTGLSEQQIRTALKKLKSTKEITIKICSKFSIISIVKWDEYQVCNQSTNQQPTSNQPATNQQPTTDKNVKNVKNVKKDSYGVLFLEFWKLYPKQRRGDKDQTLKAWKKALKDKKTTEKEMINGVQRYKNSDEVKRGYGKGAAAWINAGKYKDDYTIPDKGNGASDNKTSYSSQIIAAAERAGEQLRIREEERDFGAGGNAPFDEGGETDYSLLPNSGDIGPDTIPFAPLGDAQEDGRE